MHLAGIALVLGALVIATECQKQKNCYARDDNPYLFFGSKTAYEFVKSKARVDDVPYCQPVQLWMLARHGTRFPKEAEIMEMKALFELRNQIIRNHEDRHDGSMCEEDLRNLKKWNLDVAPSQKKEITPQGRADLEFIARRYKTKFSALLTRHYTSDTFTFRYTDTQRTRASAEAFAKGLFGGSEGNIRLPYPIRNDSLIESYKNCTTWQQKIDDNPDTLLEQEMFINGTHMQTLLGRVSDRLGFRYRMKMSQIDVMYDMCRYDKAWQINELSPWCSVFTREELKLLEYKEDLKTYYKSGYGNEINGKLGCMPVKDLYDKFSLLANETANQPVGVFYFSHSTAIRQTLTSLGIAKDIPKLLHNNYEMMQYRKWQTSKIGPFASNIAAVFFKCSRGDPHRVMFFLQEEIVQYDGCDVGLCSWDFIKEKFAKLSQECNLNWCRDGFNSAPVAKAGAWFLALVALVTLNH